jgi:hypothetical protein
LSEIRLTSVCPSRGVRFRLPGFER